MNKEQIIDDSYKFFKNSFPMKKSNPPKDYINEKGQLLTKEEFINKIKTDTEFSEKWGLKIGERELSLEERVDLMRKRTKDGTVDYDNRHHYFLDTHNVPTKQITLEYNNEKTYYYE